ncbi:hypothetical protein ACFE04_018656 [Oxalis oulophora]
MEKSWIKITDRKNKKYIDGVNTFLNWAFSQPGVPNHVLCPCKKCKLADFKNRVDIRADLFTFGFLESYEKWVYHGENLLGLDPSEASKKKKAKFTTETRKDADEESRVKEKTTGPLPGKISELEFLVKILALKDQYKLTDAAIDDVLTIVKEDMLPHSVLIPKTCSEARKITEMVDGIKEGVKAEVRDEIRESVKAELRSQVEEEVRAQAKSELYAQFQDHMTSFLSKGGTSSGNQPSATLRTSSGNQLATLGTSSGNQPSATLRTSPENQLATLGTSTGNQRATLGTSTGNQPRPTRP